jgi:hypothetical protein
MPHNLPTLTVAKTGADVGLSGLCCTLIFGHPIDDKQEYRQPFPTPPSRDVTGQQLAHYLTRMKKFYLAVECAVITLAIPLYLFYGATQTIMLSLLWGGALVCWLWLRGSISTSALWHGPPLQPDVRTMLLRRFVLMTVAAVALVLVWQPDRLLAFPMQRPDIWLMVMVLYPFLSALPQEVIYRAFFMRRYAPVVPSVPVLATLSAVAFGLSHLLMNNWVAPLLSLFGGLMFAHTYVRTGSLKWVAIEHAAYGCMLFTVGLGWYFYVGNWR